MKQAKSPQKPPKDETFSISGITAYLRHLLENDPLVQDVWVEGEISNYKAHNSGHHYFTLKDPSAQLKCVMFKGDAIHLKTKLRDGQKIAARGHISIYEAGGQHQLYCKVIRPLEEVGDLHAQMRALWNKLEAEGLFDPEAKRPIPRLPSRIGIVTSPSAAGYQDVLNILRRRYPMAEVYLSETLVQGENAPPQIVRALQRVDAFGVDVILLIRGGGSIEDMWCFNDERVARAIRAVKTPVIVGVGHETDTTIADGAADQRASTPSAAAEMATPVTLEQLQESLARLPSVLLKPVQRLIADQREALRMAAHQLKASRPDIADHRQMVDEITTDLEKGMALFLARQNELLAGQQRALNASNPANLLARGYAIFSQGGKRINRIADVSLGQAMHVQLADGVVKATVEAVRESSAPFNPEQ
jgi:exodeoxyribonuclease VII large subunit